MRLKRPPERGGMVQKTYMFASITVLPVSNSPNDVFLPNSHGSVQTADWYQLTLGVASPVEVFIHRYCLVGSADKRTQRQVEEKQRLHRHRHTAKHDWSQAVQMLLGAARSKLQQKMIFGGATQGCRDAISLLPQLRARFQSRDRPLNTGRAVPTSSIRHSSV